MTQACCNSGPFIHLAQINLLHIFSLFPHIYTTPQVIVDISKGSEPGIKNIPFWKNLKVKRVNRKEIDKIKRAVSKFKLDDTEASVISLCEKLKVQLFLTDDLDAREAGMELGLDVHGSVGIIVKAYRLGLITFKDAEKGINDLYDESSLFVTKGIVIKAIRKLRRNE